jgi:DNA adenine methylase
VYAFWHSVVHETDAMIDRILDAEISIESWLMAREIKQNPGSYSLLDIGFATFFLSRTNRSGILNGGVIGGLKQKGEWKIDCRFNKEELVSRIKRIGFFRTRICVCNMDASKFLSEYMTGISSKCFIYIDPPYYVKGAYLYQNHFEHKDHVNLAEIVSDIKDHKWVVSYDNAPQICEIYKKFGKEKFDINYSARSYSKGTEVMIFCDGLKMPVRIYTSGKERRLVSGA